MSVRKLKELMDELKELDDGKIRRAFEGAFEDAAVSRQFEKMHIKEVDEFENAVSKIRFAILVLLDDLDEFPTDDELFNAGYEYFRNLTCNTTSLDDFDEYEDGIQSYASDMAEAYPNMFKDYAASMIHEGMLEAVEEVRTELEKL